MLRSTNRVLLNPATTGVTLTVTHALGTVPDVVFFTPLSNIGQGRTYAPLAGRTADTLTVINSLETNVTVDVYSWAYQGRLY